MRLRKLEVLRTEGHVGDLRGAAAGQNRRAGLLVRVRDGDGCIGQGEASPLPGYSPDTLEECAEQLKSIDVTALSGSGDFPVGRWVENALTGSAVAAPAARFGFETALLDWLGQRLGVSVTALLAGPDAATRRVPLAALVNDLPAARAAFARGIRTFKLKISPTTWRDDLHLARVLRKELGAAIALRFDANRGLSPTDATTKLRELAEFAPEFVEEPVPSQEFKHLTDSPVPLAADESLALPGAWPALAAVCRVLVLKPTLLGGLSACLALARDATSRGLAAVVTHTYDGPLALAAAAELAAALPGRVLACGLDRHNGLAAWPEVAIPQLGPDYVESAGRPGLGLPEIKLA